MPRLINLDKVPSRSQRPPRESLPPWKPSQGSRRVLELLVRYRYLSPQLVTWYIEQKGLRGGYQALHELTRVWRHGLAQRYPRPAEPWTYDAKDGRRQGPGSSQYVYTATLAGARMVVGPEDWSAERKGIEARAREPQVSFDHALAITLLQMLWDLGGPSSPLATTAPGGYWSDRDPASPVGRGFAVELSSAKKDVEYRKEHGLDPGKPRKYRVFPDTTVLLDWGTHTWPVFFEIERTHKNEKRELERLKAYVELLTRQRDVAGDVFVKAGYGQPRAGMVVFIGATHAHAVRLATTARVAIQLADLKKADGYPAMLFGSLETLIAGERVEDEDGKTRYVESIIEPAAFFSEKLFNGLDGKLRPLLGQ